MAPIGYVKCPELKTRDDYLAKEKGLKYKGELVVDEKFQEALDEIETFDHVWLIIVFHLNIGLPFRTKVYPRVDPSNLRGTFVTRTPRRPNPIGLSCVEVLGHEKNILYFNNSDILDGTPVLDIKPYIPDSDSFPGSKAGWLDNLR
jgi:tRNA-Thr(GGU) m(6)t(6)A37 methyltransferase TsaA